MVKLFKFSREEDYGTDFTLDLLIFRRFTLIGFYFGWSDYSGSFCMQISSGMAGAFNALIGAGKFSFEVYIGRANHVIRGDEPWLDQ